VVSGNIGYPLTASLPDGRSETIFVVELSSFQLEHIESFRPWVAVMLNITEDHLDWHSDFADYARAKARLFENQTENDFAILNLDDQVVKSLAGKVKARLIPTSKSSRQAGGLYLDDGWIISEFNGKVNIIQIADLKIKGEHNLDNVMASTAAAQVAGVPAGTIRKVLTGFRGLNHRIQFVAEIDGVSYYNDSKATNPDATVKALTAFIQPVVLLVGGRNKNNSFVGLAKEIEEKVKTVVLFGEAADEIRSALSDRKVEMIQVVDLPEAVEEAAKIALPGEVVLLSPACASFDQFQNYEERGDAFIALVERLKGVRLES
jgi:UDP-N-acetylmuramoylalanine--D-glutamate ligase